MVRPIKKEKHFALESDMCRAFIDNLPKGWTAYAETGGWDILLSRDSDGFQIGIQAKLKFNAAVVTQALESSAYCADQAGPDCRAILIPSNEQGFDTICAYLGLMVIAIGPQAHWGEKNKLINTYRFNPDLPTLQHSYPQWHEWLPTKRHKLPDYVPDVTAGSAAPLQLTEWKINAIKMCILLARRGYLTRADFKHVRIDHRRWLPGGQRWLVIADGGRCYKAGPRLPDLKAVHPRNWAEIEADYEKWAPPELPGMTALAAA
jgi:hypothetical protein